MDKSTPPTKVTCDGLGLTVTGNPSWSQIRSALSEYFGSKPRSNNLNLTTTATAIAERAAPVLRKPTHAEKAFWDFHIRHPEVYRALVRAARKWTGPRKIGFNVFLASTKLKLNNNHRPYYARLLRGESGLQVIFSLRRCPSNGEPYLGFDTADFQSESGVRSKKRKARRKRGY